MTIARLIRTVQFSAAHRYYRPEWSPERNREAFGACANEHGHGHSYHCSVTVSGALAESTSMVFALADFDTILREEVVGPLDHQHLNFVVPEFAAGTSIPTAEALAAHIWNRVAGRFPDGVTLYCVRIQEDAYLAAEYYGESE